MSAPTQNPWLDGQGETRKIAANSGTETWNSTYAGHWENWKWNMSGQRNPLGYAWHRVDE